MELNVTFIYLVSYGIDIVKGVKTPVSKGIPAHEFLLGVTSILNILFIVTYSSLNLIKLREQGPDFRRHLTSRVPRSTNI